MICPFCTNHERGQEVIQRQLLFATEKWNVIFDHKPLTKGHLILTPKEHRSVRSDLTAEENADLFNVYQKVHECYQKVFGYTSNITYEKNGLGIPHFQIHLLPVSSKLHSVWVQIMLFVRTFTFNFWSLNAEKLAALRNEFLAR
ncbi:MAG: HIT family protein [Parachlamydia sp.]|jgi:histidine triad (HIT) family protein|nr:HIT family protein [Parachlamydia sp.]